jgi:hypothetical protein
LHPMPSWPQELALVCLFRVTGGPADTSPAGPESPQFRMCRDEPAYSCFGPRGDVRVLAASAGWLARNLIH